MQTLDAENRIWDVIVIGAGMGGGLVGRRLAEKGHRVLFVEKGPRGHRHEGQGLADDVTDPAARLVRGYWPVPVRAVVEGQTLNFYAPIGAGVGGSSVFYAGSLERPERHDLEATPGHPHPTGGWPVSYDAFQPYFDDAQRLLGISGTPDPLSREDPGPLAPPPPLSEGDANLLASFRDGGLHPYRLHSAIGNVEGCLQCVGRKCPKSCKKDGRSAGVEPALETGLADILDLCDVREIQEEKGYVSRLVCDRQGVRLHLRARIYILAAGALNSPRLLLASAASSKRAIANSSGWVGRGLMFHLDEYFAIWPKKAVPGDGPSKSIAFRDLYSRNGDRFGMVQSLGVDATYGIVAMHIKQLYERSRFPKLKLVHNGLNVLAAVACRYFGNAKIFAGMVEDLPRYENRVIFDPDDPDVPVFHYEIPEELHHRRRLYRSAIRKAMKGMRLFHLTKGPQINYGHPMGTLRFGDDPKSSVLDRSCRSHDLANLYVADASFMPTSTGVNPSLTIGANSLRVAEIVSDRLKEANQQND